MKFGFSLSSKIKLELNSPDEITYKFFRDLITSSEVGLMSKFNTTSLLLFKFFS